MENTSEEEIIIEVKKKKEFVGLPDKIVREVLAHQTKKYPQIIQPTSSEKKVLVKEIRALLRRSTGMFQKGSEKKRQVDADPHELLKTHRSTAERINDYPLLKEKIPSLQVKSILDIGCGLNPLALASPAYLYYACDIRQDEIELIQSHFKKKSIPGKAFVYDLRTYASDLPAADLCLIWKVLDIIPGDKYTLTRKLLASLQCACIIISFSTRTLSGKPMQHKRRFWFESILKELSLSYETWETSNELFYVIHKKN